VSAVTPPRGVTAISVSVSDRPPAAVEHARR
jgi:hypothetical protein